MNLPTSDDEGELDGDRQESSPPVRKWSWPSGHSRFDKGGRDWGCVVIVRHVYLYPKPESVAEMRQALEAWAARNRDGFSGDIAQLDRQSHRKLRLTGGSVAAFVLTHRFRDLSEYRHVSEREWESTDELLLAAAIGPLSREDAQEVVFEELIPASLHGLESRNYEYRAEFYPLAGKEDQVYEALGEFTKDERQNGRDLVSLSKRMFSDSGAAFCFSDSYQTPRELQDVIARRRDRALETLIAIASLCRAPFRQQFREIVARYRQPGAGHNPHPADMRAQPERGGEHAPGEGTVT